MRLELPFPPSTNHYWRNITIQGRARTVISKPGRVFRQNVARAIGSDHRDLQPLSGRLKVRVELHPPCRRKRDVDNYLKGLLDAITHAGHIWVDDEQIDELTIVRRGKCQGGRANVEVTEL